MVFEKFRGALEGASWGTRLFVMGTYAFVLNAVLYLPSISSHNSMATQLDREAATKERLVAKCTSLTPFFEMTQEANQRLEEVKREIERARNEANAYRAKAARCSSRAFVYGYFTGD